ncbi:MAG TPA: SAM-dependent methyltransferase [Anaerolineaceae bacterium]|nr:SAM-dependent methyltransferase [Anaerolineaceae bacterium]
MSERRIETRSSETASFTCFSRGCATRERDPRFRGPDDMAELLFPPMAKLMLNVAPLRKIILRQMFPPGMHEYIFARTKVMDAAFGEALDACFLQIVLLGAGFDTRALRFASRNQGTKIFELDAPTTQQAKLEVLRRKKISLPSELVFVPINFDREEISTALTKAGYQVGQRTLFLCEGVTMYLTAQVVDKTLDYIRSSSAPGSRVVFDYLLAAVIRKENRYYGEQQAFDRVARVGESWIFGLEDGEIGPFLAERGFELIVNYTSVDLEKLFLTEPDGKLHARVNGTHCIATAAVQ